MEFKKEDLMKLYRNMVLARKLDEAIIESITTPEGVTGMYHSGAGPGSDVCRRHGPAPPG